MKKQLFHFTLYAILVYLTGCGVIDCRPRFDRGSTQSDKQYSDQYPEPYTVRLIYFLPSDRQPEPNIDTKMDKLIKNVRNAYANDMEQHGFGRKTFRFETDTTGQAVVHHVSGKFTAKYYQYGTLGKVNQEVGELFDTSKNIYLIAINSGYYAAVAGGGTALISSVFSPYYDPYYASHELRHTFGLWHDYSTELRGFAFEISKCTAEFLDVHPYFNAPRQSPNLLQNTTIQMFPPSLAFPPNGIRFRFEVTDPDGLHSARLHMPQNNRKRTGGFLACKRLAGTSSTVEFVTTALTPEESVFLHVIDVHGNLSESQRYPIDIASLLPPPKVVSIPDANLAAAVRESLGQDTLTSHTILQSWYIRASYDYITDLTGLKHAINLRHLYLDSNSISDLSPLEGLTNLTDLYLRENFVSDLSPLVANMGLGKGDAVNVKENPLSYQSIRAHIPALQSRGITVEFENRTPTSLVKISGDLHGSPAAPLSKPLVVEVQDERGAAFERVPVTFTVTAGGGTLSVQHTTTDKNGRAESTLTLGSNLGTNTVSVYAVGIRERVRFTAVARKGGVIPDSDL